MPRDTVTGKLVLLTRTVSRWGSTVVGQEDADFETIPEETATDEFKAAKAKHLLIERGLTYEVKIVGYRELLD